MALMTTATTTTEVNEMFQQGLVSDLEMTASELGVTLDLMVSYGAEQLPVEAGALADAYHFAHAASKSLEDVKGRVRAELLLRLAEGETNANSHTVFVGNTATVEARPRVSAKMDEVAMAALLAQHALALEATDLVVKVERPGDLESKLRALAVDLDQRQEPKMAQVLRDLLGKHFTTTEVINEKKVEKLVKAGKLDANEAAATYSTTTNYALYDVTT